MTIIDRWSELEPDWNMETITWGSRIVLASTMLITAAMIIE